MELTLKAPSELLIPKRLCHCGCNEQFQTRNKTQLFISGHDSRLKSLLRKVNRGEVSADQIPKIALESIDKIKFLRTDPEMASAASKGLALL